MRMTEKPAVEYFTYNLFFNVFSRLFNTPIERIIIVSTYYLSNSFNQNLTKGAKISWKFTHML